MCVVWTVWDENVAIKFYVTHVNGTKYCNIACILGGKGIIAA